MSEMVERVARAMWEQRRKAARAFDIELEAWDDGTYPRMNGVFEEARAAIEAMHEPTDEMVLAATTTPGSFTLERALAEGRKNGMYFGPRQEAILPAIYTSMIDAALNAK